ncbi:MAG: leucyl/phenylalanyl-tRNA--protein transferase [Nitrospirae bacterium]|nr:leucyl/phenylalanyl-tRNA--protein transferase [Nitrospirota bacterium]
MPVFRLSDEIIFPPPELAEEDGLLAAGGDLSEERLIRAYSMGIFPWYSGTDKGTWITDEMIEAYIKLHRSGYAHSIESWVDGELAGGLYGVALGSAFFGESMFAKKSNASKAAFAALVQQLQKWKFNLIDCQVTTEHLRSFGAREIARTDFLKILRSSLKAPAGKWAL